MSTIYTKQQLMKQYEKLPDILKEALFSVETAEKIFAIGKKSGLTVEKIGFLAEETGRVILGLTRPREFVSALARRLETDTETARKIALDINHQIFFPLREALKQTHQVEVGEAAMMAGIKNQESRIKGETAATAAPTPAAPAKGPAPIVLGPLPAKPPDERGALIPQPAPAKPAPAPLVEGIPRPESIRPAKFLTREEVEEMVAERRGIKKQELRIKGEDAPTQLPAPSAMPQPALAPPMPKPQIPPIDLRQTAPEISIKNQESGITEKIAAPSAMPPAAKPLISAPSPQTIPRSSPIVPQKNHIDLRRQAVKPEPQPWQGADPYREPVE